MRQGFWPDAHVTRAERRSEGWALSYAAPTAIFKKAGMVRWMVLSLWMEGEVEEVEEVKEVKEVEGR